MSTKCCQTKHSSSIAPDKFCFVQESDLIYEIKVLFRSVKNVKHSCRETCDLKFYISIIRCFIEHFKDAGLHG